MGRGNEVLILWVPAHVGDEGNEVADGMAREAAAGQIYGVEDQVRWQASLPHLSRRLPHLSRRLPHLSRRATERRSEVTSSGSETTSGQSDDTSRQEAPASGGGR